MPTAQQAYAMLGNEDLWDISVHCHGVLAAAGIPHVICGGVAVCLHGYQRNTTDLDLVIEASDAGRIREAFLLAGYLWHPDECEFRTERGLAIQFLHAGERAGKDSEVRLPHAVDVESVEMIEGLPVLRLSKLIESKLACGMGSARRMHRDFADVVELIAVRKLDSSFARHLHKSLRETFRQLVRNVR